MLFWANVPAVSKCRARALPQIKYLTVDNIKHVFKSVYATQKTFAFIWFRAWIFQRVLWEVLLSGIHERHFMYSVESSGNSCNKNDIKRQSQRGRRNLFYSFAFLKTNQPQENDFFIFVERSWFVKTYDLYLDRESELDTHSPWHHIVLHAFFVSFTFTFLI